MALWVPVATFVTSGLEHSIANMFFCTLGIAMGAPITFSGFILNNLLPVTIGNTLAGVCFMAVPYSLAYGALGKPKPATS
eukprot:gene4164-14264_t